MEEKGNLEVVVTLDSETASNAKYDLDKIVFDLDSQLDSFKSKADGVDCIVAAGSGLLCALLDIVWVGEFSLERGRGIASEKVDSFVKRTAKMLGCKDDDLASSVRFLEGKFPIPSDGNTPDFGGGLQHHLRDFAHHPTIVGLAFSLLTQFTGKSYGTDKNGVFKVIDVPERSLKFIGKDVPQKNLFGTVYWFFHLVSDMAGSSSSTIAGVGGGTGIPGPILSLAKELSALPVFKNMNASDNSLSVFLSKIFNGTLLAKHDEAGKIIPETALRFDLRGELGVAAELGRQAIPVVANECIVRSFYFIRRFATEIKENEVATIGELRQLNWESVKPADNPTIARMLTIATGVFTTVDIAEAVITQKYWLSINYIGVGRFALAIGTDVSWGLKARNVKRIKDMYETIGRNAYRQIDDNIYERIGKEMQTEKFGLTVEQTEILYNIEYYKTLNDISTTQVPINSGAIKSLKRDWLNEWKEYISAGFASFLQVEDAEMHWYSEDDLLQKIAMCEPQKPWLRLVMLEAMLFEPYFALGTEENKKGKEIPSRKYKDLENPINNFNRGRGDSFLETFPGESLVAAGLVKRLRKCYNKVVLEMKEVLKGLLVGGAITAGIVIAAVATGGILAGPIAVALVGSNFAGLSGAALTSACLAYIGGGAIAAGGAGMLGGTMAIVGGGAALGLGVGAGVGGVVGSVGVLEKKNTILQSAKLLVSVREIFMNDEHDMDFSNSVYEEYVQNITDIEKGLVDLKLQADVASSSEKKELKSKIKEAQESVEVMRIARKSLLKFKSAFEEGQQVE